MTSKQATEVASWAAHEANPERRAYLFSLAEALERGGWPKEPEAAPKQESEAA